MWALAERLFDGLELADPTDAGPFSELDPIERLMYLEAVRHLLTARSEVELALREIHQPRSRRRVRPKHRRS